MSAGLQLTATDLATLNEFADLAAEIRDRQVRRAMRYVRACDWLADQVAKADPTRSASEWRSWALARAAITARGERQASKEGCNG